MSTALCFAAPIFVDLIQNLTLLLILFVLVTRGSQWQWPDGPIE